jgi:hypothetical protein
MKTMFWLLCAALMAQSCFAQSSQRCSGATIDLLGKALNNSAGPPINLPGAISSAACKPLPADQNTLVAAIAYSGTAQANKGAAEGKELFLALINQQNKQIIASYHGFIEEDASLRVDENSLRIDTAAYALADGVRAFGVDVLSAYMPNCGDGSFGALRSLYLREGRNLRPVLNDFFTTTSMHRKGSNCASDASESLIEKFDRYLSTGQNSHHGLRDLAVTITSKMDNGSQSPRRPFHFTLQYDGKKYPTTALEEAFSSWSR